MSDGAIGLSVVTLRTGEIQGTSIVQDAGSRPSAVAWSPDGAVVAWLSESPSNSLYGTHITTGIRPTRPTTKGVSSGRSGLVGVAVADDRTAAVGTRQGDLLLETGGDTQKVAGRLDGFPANFSPDGTALALENRMIPSPVSSTLEVSTGKQWRHPFPADTLGPATTRPLGWLDDRLQLILAQESFDEDAEFVITTPKVSGLSTWRRSVGFVDPTVVSSLSVAVDLMPNLDGTSSQQFTHDFGEPDWVSQRDISWIIGLGVAGALSVLYGLRWLWRRRTSL